MEGVVSSQSTSVLCWFAAMGTDSWKFVKSICVFTESSIPTRWTQVFLLDLKLILLNRTGV